MWRLLLIVFVTWMVHNLLILHDAQKLGFEPDRNRAMEYVKNEYNSTTSASDLCGPLRSLEVIRDGRTANRLLHSNIAIGERTALVFDRQDGSWSIPIVWDVFVHELSEIRFSLARSCILQPHLALKVYIKATGELLETKLIAIADKDIKRGGGAFPVICSVSSEKLQEFLVDFHTVRVDMTVHVGDFKKDVSISVSSTPKARMQHKLVTGTALNIEAVPNRLISFITHHMSIGFTHFYFYALFSLKTMPNEMREYLNEFATKNPDTLTITQWFGYWVPATHSLYGLSESMSAFINTLAYRLRAKSFSTWIASIDTDEFLTPNRNLSAYIRAHEGKTHNIPFQQSYFYLNPAGTTKPSRSAVIFGDGNFTYAILNGSTIVSEGCEKNYHLVSRNKNLFSANGMKFMAIHFPEMDDLVRDTRYSNGLQCFLHFAPTTSYRNEGTTRFDFIENKNNVSSLKSLLAFEVVDMLKWEPKQARRNLTHNFLEEVDTLKWKPKEGRHNRTQTLSRFQLQILNNRTFRASRGSKRSFPKEVIGQLNLNNHSFFLRPTSRGPKRSFQKEVIGPTNVNNHSFFLRPASRGSKRSFQKEVIGPSNVNNHSFLRPASRGSKRSFQKEVIGPTNVNNHSFLRPASRGSKRSFPKEVIGPTKEVPG